MSTLFVTGASGFVGRRLLTMLRHSNARDVRFLSRHPSALRASPDWDPTWECVEGDLNDSSTYSSRIPAGGRLIHLAGAVGRRPAHDFRRVNVDGTRALVAAAVARATHFTLVSSIAAQYPDLEKYPYGRSKLESEGLVVGSGIPYTILRPTIILGSGSTSLEALARLALLPVPVMFGDGRVETQPVSVNDVARLILRASVESWHNEIVEVGGPEVVSMNALFARIRALRGREPRRPVHLPVAGLRSALSALEQFLGAALPVTAGQLAAFAYPSSACSHPRILALQNDFENLACMIGAEPRSAVRLGPS